MSRKKHKKSGPNLFSEEQLDAMTVRKHGYQMIKFVGKDGKTYERPDNRKTKEDFIRKSQAIWGDQYDYSETVYTGSKSPVTIRCKKHNHYFTVPFAQNHYMKPHGNVKPTGCDLCTIERTGIRPPRGPHHFRTPEEIQQEAAEKARRHEERRQRAEQNKYERSEEARLKRQMEEQAYIKKWQAKNFFEARFKERVFQMYGDQYDMSLVDYQGNDKEVTLLCPKHGFFEIKPRHLLTGISHGTTKKPPHGCWKCCGLPDPHEKHVMTAKEFNQKVRRIYQHKPLTFPIRKKIKMSSKVTATCAKHGKITHDAQWWLDGKGCEYCNGKWYAPDWKEYARAKHGDKYQYIGEPPKKQNDYIHYICPKHGEIKQRYDIHVIQGWGCSKCSNYPNKKTPMERCQEWIAKCIEKYGEGRYDYSRAHEDYVNNDSQVLIRCCIHDHWFRTSPDNNLRSVNGSCPICSIEFRESEGEATIRRWLQKHGILDFEQEYQLPNEDPTLPLQYLSADFYLLHGREYIIIEYHGEQHYKDIPHFYEGRVRNFAVQQHRDRYLRQYCHDNGIRLIEIPYSEFNRIDEILTAELLNINT